MRIEIDRSVCTGHGRCYSLVPDLFDSDDEGYGVVRADQVAGGDQDRARSAVANCPEGAITVTD